MKKILPPRGPMESYLFSDLYDLITPDGRITQISAVSTKERTATVFIEKISPAFVGFRIDPSRVFFNGKSTLAQLGVNITGIQYHLDPKK